MTVQPEEVVAEAKRSGSPVFRRILLKLSGESLMGDQEYGMDRATIDAIAEEIVDVQASGSTGACRLRPREWTGRPRTTPGCSQRC